ncbi:hypothetical protein [Legionella rowbothamii]|uniref:hypothetical protein n=1 Tax=Legionella rowbothamii TaxID=96229 RepID=UPI0010542D2E|nr:hypothetical protein [Legionella rowbothamii]
MKIKVIPDLSIPNMSNLVDEMIEILKHNQAVIAEIERRGGNSNQAPIYQKYQNELENTKARLTELSEYELTEEDKIKLEIACAYFCLYHLVYGSRIDELYLCKLIDADTWLKHPSKGIVGKLENCTDHSILLANKYALFIEKGSDYYAKRFEQLVSEIQDQYEYSSSMRP